MVTKNVIKKDNHISNDNYPSKDYNGQIWMTENLKEMAKYLYQNKNLMINELKIVDSKIFYLLGQTPLGTTYEIKLIPTLLYYWVLI